MDIADLSDIVELHGKAIYGFCYNLTKNKSDTDDLYQEAFLKATEMCYRIDKENNPKSFIISLAIGIWKNNRRKHAWRHRIVPINEFNEDLCSSSLLQNDLTPEDIALSKELSKLIQGAADTLNDKLRIPLYMYYTADLSVEDIAKALKTPPGTVKSRLYKARKVIKNIMEANEYERF